MFDEIKKKSAYHAALCEMLESVLTDENKKRIEGVDVGQGIENVINAMRKEAKENASGGVGVITPDRAMDILAGEFGIEIPNADTQKANTGEIVDVMDLL